MDSNMTGFIGLGIMGKPMAKNLLKSKCPLMVYDINPSAVNEMKKEGAQAGTPAEIGSSCSVVFTMLPNGPIVQDVLFGEHGLAESLQPGSLVVDMSSVTPLEAQTCAEKLLKQNVRFMDAPVSGGEPKAIDGTLAIMAGGRQEDFDRALPFFQAMGSSAVLIGPCGSGCVTKLANQIIVNLNITAVSEAMVLAQKAGVDPAKVYPAIRGGLAGSAVLDAKAPMMIKRDFKPGGKISINLKDIKNVMETAHNIDAPLPFTGLLLEVLQSLKVNGHVNDDHSGIVQHFEALAGVKVQGK